MFDHESNELRKLIREGRKLMATIQEAVDGLNKLATDVTTLVNSNQGGITPASLDAVVAQVKTIDDAVVAATPVAPAPPA